MAQRELAECTFKPRLASKSPSQQQQRQTPSGYEDSVNRMRMAIQEKQRQKEALDK